MKLYSQNSYALKKNKSLSFYDFIFSLRSSLKKSLNQKAYTHFVVGLRLALIFICTIKKGNIWVNLKNVNFYVFYFLLNKKKEIKNLIMTFFIN